MERELDPYELHYDKKSLHQKAYAGDINAIKRWLADGGSPDVRAKNGQTLLHAAVHGCRSDIVQLLIASGADVNANSNETPYYTFPIQIAVGNGALDIVNALITHGADITVETENGCTLINIAVLNNQTAVIQYLLDREADIEIPARYGVTPLCSATMHDYKDAAELLLRAGANPNAEYLGGLTPLAQNHDPEVTNMLIEYGADVNYIGYNGRSPIFYSGSLDVLKVMLAHGARLDVIDVEGNTLLHQAVSDTILVDFETVGDRDVYRASPEGMWIAKLFVERGMDINIRNNEGQTPFALAIEEENEDIADFLRAHGGVV